MHGRQIDGTEQAVKQRRVQLGGVADIHVQRGRPGVELLREAAHGHLLQALGPKDLDRGADDALAGERRFGGPLAAAARNAGRGVRPGECQFQSPASSAATRRPCSRPALAAGSRTAGSSTLVPIASSEASSGRTTDTRESAARRPAS